MDTSEGAPPAGGLRGALARLGESALGLVRTRAQLAGMELAEERERLVLRLALLIAGGVVLAFSGLFVGVFVIALLWDSYRLTAIAAVAVLYALGGWLLISKAQAIGRDAPPPFAATLAEFEKDRIRVRAAGDPTRGSDHE